MSLTPGSRPAASVLVDGVPHAAPGHVAQVRVHVRNLTAEPRAITVGVLGLDGAWVPGPVTTQPVAPDATVTLVLPVSVGPGAVPGHYPFALAVQAHPASAVLAAHPLPAVVVDATLRVDAPGTVMLSVEPAESDAVFGRRLTVVLTNGGTQPVPLDLAAAADAGLRVRLRRGAVVVPAQSSVRVRARARVTRPALLGHRDRHGFSVAALGREHAPVRAQGSLTSRPLVGSGAVGLVALAMVVVLWVAGAAAGLPWLARHLAGGDQDTVALTHATPTPSGTATTGGPGRTGAGTTGAGKTGSGKGGAGKAGTASSAGTVRIAGVVTADDPSGFRVAIAPVASPSTAAGTTGATQERASRVPAKIAAWAVAPPRPGPVQEARGTVTQKDGGWGFADMSATTSYLVTVSKRGFETRRFVLTGAQAVATPPETVMVAGTGRLSGVVTGDVPGTPGASPARHRLAGATVTVTDGTTTSTTTTTPAKGAGGAAGSWTVTGLATPSTYLVTVTAPGQGPASQLVSLDAAGSARLVTRLRTGVASVRGMVLGPDGRGLGGITVTATSGGVVRTATTATGADPATDAAHHAGAPDAAGAAGQGSFVLADLPVPGTWTVTASGPGWATSATTVRLTPGSSGRLPDMRLTPAGGVVDGTVSGAGGPLEGAGLVLSNADHVYKTTSAGVRDGTTLLEARYRFDGVAPGRYVLSAELFGYTTGYQQIEVTAGAEVTRRIELVEAPVTAPTTSRITGTVVDATTTGELRCPVLLPDEVCEAKVTVVAPTGPGAPAVDEATAAPGRPYTLPPPSTPPAPPPAGLPPGVYTLQVEAPGYVTQQVSVDVGAGRDVVAPTVALLPMPAIAGRVGVRAGSLPEGSCVVAVPVPADGAAPAPEQCPSPAPAGPDPTCALSARSRQHCAYVVDGSYQLRRLDPGSYAVSVLPAGGEYTPVAAVVLTVQAGQVQRYDPTVDRLGVVALTVMSDAGGAALLRQEGATVTLVRVKPAGPETKEGVTLADGSLRVSGLVPGTYQLRAAHPADCTGDCKTRGETPEFDVGLNEELALQIVVVPLEQPSATARLVWSDGQGVRFAGGVDVEVTGVVGYTGLIPSRATRTRTTDANGAFEVTGFKGSLVSLEIDDTRFAHLLRTEVPITSLDDAPIVLEPRGVPVTVALRFEDSDGKSLLPQDVALDKVRVTVVEAPPGASAARVVVAADGTATWQDLAQPAAPDGAGATLARPGRYRVLATLDGFDTVDVPLDVPLAESPPGPTPTQTPTPTPTPPPTGQLALTLQQFGTLTVNATTASGHAVADPVVTLKRAGDPDVTLTATPGTNSVSFGRVARGEYTLTVRAAGYAFVVDKAQTMTNGLKPVDVPLTPLASIEGTVSATTADEGRTRTLAGVTVTATLGGVAFSAVTDADGRYRITGTTTSQGLVGGHWLLRVTAAGYHAQQQETADIGPGSSEVKAHDIRLDPDPVLFVVRLDDADESDTGDVDGLDVVLLTANGRPIAIGRGPGTTRGCDAPTSGGRFCFKGLVPDTYTLDVSGPGYAPLTVTVTVPAGASTQVSLQVVARTNTISGTVSGQAGAAAAAPIGDAEVGLRADPPSAGTGRTTTTSPSGAFSFSDLSDGAYVLTFGADEDDDYPTVQRAVVVRGGQVASLDVVLFATARAVTVTVTSTNGYDLTGALVALTPVDPGSTPLAAQPVTRTSPSGTTYETVFPQVPPGAWTAAVSGPAGHVGTWTASVGVSATTASVAVTELRVRVAASSADASAPESLGWTLARTDQGHAGTVATGSVAVDAGADVVFVDAAGSYLITPAASPGWTVSPGSVTPPGGKPDALAAFVLAKAAAPPQAKVARATPAPAPSSAPPTTPPQTSPTSQAPQAPQAPPTPTAPSDSPHQVGTPTPSP
ncbi:MAG: carboxypeptidase regulatory-like domain-containing protein [Kineosporiaceae bacterium]